MALSSSGTSYHEVPVGDRPWRFHLHLDDHCRPWVTLENFIFADIFIDFGHVVVVWQGEVGNDFLEGLFNDNNSLEAILVPTLILCF